MNKATMVLTGDIHFNEYPRFPDMFGHLKDVFRDMVETAEENECPLVILGDTLDPLHGSISARVLDPVCELFAESGQRVRIVMIKGNHGRGAAESGDHLETPLGMIEGVEMLDEPCVRLVGNIACAFFPYFEYKEDFIKAVKELNQDIKVLGAAGHPTLALTHQGYRGGYVGPDEPGFMPDEEHGAWSLPATLFQHYDQVVGGHFHRHQTLYLGDVPTTYVGAPLQHNFGDEGQARGFVLVRENQSTFDLEHVRHHERYPIFRKPSLTADNLPEFLKEDLTTSYVQPIVTDPNVTEEELEAIQCYRRFPTLWKTTDEGRNRLGITSDSSPEEILASYVEAKCPDLSQEDQEAIFAAGMELYYDTPREEKEGGSSGEIRPVALEMKHFRRIRHEVFDFPEKGVTVFAGKNGAGKSTAFMGVIYALFGDLPGTAESPINNVIGKGCMVRFTFFRDEQLYTVMRHRKDSKYKDKLLFFRGDIIPVAKSASNLTRATNAATQKVINEVLGVSSKIFQRIVCIRALFKLLSAQVKDGEKREFLEEAFGLEEWEGPYQTTLSEKRKESELLSDLEKDLVSYQSSRDVLSAGTADLQLKSRSWESQRQASLQAADQEVRRLNTQIGQVQAQKTSPAEVAGLRKALEDAEEALELLPKDGEAERKKYNDNRTQIVQRLGAAQAEHRAAALLLETTEKDKRFGLPMADRASTCPTCFQPISEEHIEACQKEFLAEKEAILVKARAKASEAQKRMAELRGLQEGLTKRLGNIDNVIFQRRNLKERMTQLQHQLSTGEERQAHQERILKDLDKQKKSAEKQKTAFESQEDPYQELLTKNAAQIQSITGEIEEAEEALKTSQARLECLKFWEQGFSKKGLRSYLLDTFLPRLSERIQEQLDTLSGGAIRAQLHPQREKADGTMMEAVTATVTNVNGGNLYEEQSGGEQHRLDIAGMLGVNVYSRGVCRVRVNALFLDDVLDNYLDDEGIAALSKLVKGFAADTWVGLITHKPALAAQFDDRIHVVRDTDGFSSYRR